MLLDALASRMLGMAVVINMMKSQKFACKRKLQHAVDLCLKTARLFPQRKSNWRNAVPTHSLHCPGLLYAILVLDTEYSAFRKFCVSNLEHLVSDNSKHKRGPVKACVHQHGTQRSSSGLKYDVMPKALAYLCWKYH